MQDTELQWGNIILLFAPSPFTGGEWGVKRIDQISI